MPWMELPLNPETDWNEVGLNDWAEALGAFFVERGQGFTPSLQVLPGYQILGWGEENAPGEILLSSSERVITLKGFGLVQSSDREFAEMVIRFARDMGALALKSPIHYIAEKEFWRKKGAQLMPDPLPLREAIRREKIGVEPLNQQSLLVTYQEKPVLCLEPIFCTARPPGPSSLAERRIGKLFGGGRPIGFASHVSAYSPWQIQKAQWDDLLAYSRLQAYEVLERQILESLPKEHFAPL